MSDNLRGILLVELKIEEADFVLINICNMNVQPEQLQILSDLYSILDWLEDFKNKNIAFVGDSSSFRIFFLGPRRFTYH